MAGQVFTRPTPRHAVRPDAQGNAVVSRIKCSFTKMKAVVSWRRGISGQFPVSNPRKRTPFGKSFVFSHLVKPSSKPSTGYGVGGLGNLAQNLDVRAFPEAIDFKEAFGSEAAQGGA